MRRLLPRLGCLLLTLCLCLGGMELAVRYVLITQNEFGQDMFMSQFWVPPRKLPLASSERLVEVYSAADSTYLIYDPDLGWTLAPNATAHDGAAHTNAAGMRADRDYVLAPSPDVLRVATFGDSYTYGSEVQQGESWPAQVRAQLDGVEVLNFGVGGYGLDQAYLRWQHDGQRYQPDIVMVGFVAEDVLRSLNVIRLLYWPEAGVPYSKPRFVLADDGALRLVNSPALPPDAVLATLRAWPDSPLAPYEYYYDPGEYDDHWYFESRLVALGQAIARRVDFLRDNDGQLRIQIDWTPHLQQTPAFFAPDGPGGALALAMLGAWEREVEARGAQFVVVHLPRLGDLEDHYSGLDPVHAALWDAITARFTVIDTVSAFDAGRLPDFFAPRGHYSAEGQQVIASEVAVWLAAQSG